PHRRADSTAGQTGERSVAAAIERSLPLLVEDGERWLAGEVPVQAGRGCVFCHHVGLALWSHREAVRSGVVSEDPSVADLRRRAVE
ncbi:MAG TPA: hypothetical protein VD788_01480, partial [Candidatus Polarisedimenticolaceae bacterium]|nr:hypothetical protein [Candidatus Polarisedimenticolaceae bacterium]